MELSLKDKSVKNSTDGGLKFERFQIATRHTPHRYKIPHPFLPQVRKIGLAKMLLSETIEYNFRLVKSNYRKTLFSRPCIYGVFGGKIGGFSPIQERCTGCMRCVEEFPEVCRVERNPDFTNFADSFWMPEDPNKVSDSPFATVWYEAETGKIRVRGMGYKGFFASPGWDSMWTDMSEIVRPTRDGVYGREFISTLVDIGAKPNQIEFPIRKRNRRTSTIPIPILFDYLPDNLQSRSIVKSLIHASDTVGTKYILKPKQIDKFGVNVSENLFLYIDSDNFGNIGNYLSISSGIIVDSSSIKLIERIRDINSKVPILMRLPFTNDTYDKIKNAFALGVEGFLLYADYHGTDFDTKNVFIRDLINDIHKKLVQDGTRDKLTLISSGGIILAEHIPKAVISGTDAVAINTSALVALQVKFESECRVPEESSISDTDFDPRWGTSRLVNLLGSWHNQLIEIMSAMGIKEVRRLRGDTGRAMYKEELEEVAFGDITRID